jgi:hypothetical protein
VHIGVEDVSSEDVIDLLQEHLADMYLTSPHRLRVSTPWTSTPCASPCADYQEDPNSIFMSKNL